MQRLELTWIGKGEDPAVEPRILLHDASKDYGDPSATNMLIHGDNLLALKALEQEFAGQVKCIYIDPPYNTGAAFEYYDDNLEHSIWLRLMKARLEILRNLLSPEGSIWIQIDDEEQAYLKVICDEVFGRGNFINMISVNMKNVAGASGGGEDKRLKKNCEYILSYAKEYSLLPLFNGPYTYTEMSELVQQYIDEGKSWKYTSVLVSPGEKVYYGSTVDGDGNEIKVYLKQLEGRIRIPHRNAVRMLLKILAYEKQDSLLPDKWEIEHILPQKWQAAYFMNDSEETIKERIEHIGNKLPFEKKLNIIAGNGYFDKKKKEYADSVIEVTKEMSTFDSHDWKLEQISERDIRVSDAIIAILKKWDGEYKKEPITTASDQPTPEQLAFLKEAKEKGWI